MTPAITSATTAPSPVPRPLGGAAAQRAAQAELRRSEYHRDGPGIAARVLNWIYDHLGRSVSWTVHGGPAAVGWVLLAAVVAGVVLSLRRRTRRPGVGRSGPADPLQPSDVVDHRAEATRHETAGQWPEALRAWLRAAVATIEHRGVLVPRPGRTGHMIAVEAAPLLPAAVTPLTAAVDAFDEVWFGGRPATPADVQIAREAAEAVARARIERAAHAGASATLPW